MGSGRASLVFLDVPRGSLDEGLTPLLAIDFQAVASMHNMSRKQL